MGTKTCIPTSQRPIIASKFYQKATAASLLAQPSIDPQTKTGFWKKHGATAASCQLHIGLRQLSSNGNVCSTHLHWCLAATFAPQAPTPRTLPFFSHNTTETGNSQLSACPQLNLHYLVLTISCNFQKLIFSESQFVQLADSWETSFCAHRLLKLQLHSRQLLCTNLFILSVGISDFGQR
jgi:hypothetical protein